MMCQTVSTDALDNHFVKLNMYCAIWAELKSICEATGFESIVMECHAKQYMKLKWKLL